MKKEIDIYDYPRKLASMMRYVENSKVSSRNKKIIFEFRDFISLDGISMPRIIRYLGVLKDWALILKVDFDKATKEDIIKAVRIIQEKENYSVWTKATYKAMLKRFYKWLKKTEDSPEEVRWIRTKPKKTEYSTLNNSELLTEKEITKLIDVAEHPRNKALVSILYESGCRIGEIASLQIKNISFDEHGVILNVNGKTGSRPIRLISSVPYLSTWLQNHPLKDDKEAPLWINIGNIGRYNAMKYAAIRRFLFKLFEKALIKKRFNPHMFRHSRATFLADHLTEFQMNQYFGWIQGSNMPSTYVHMSGKKIDSSILALNGIESHESKKETELKPQICPRCNTINQTDAKFCSNCAGILNVKTAHELQEKIVKEQEIRSNSDNLMNVLMKDSEFVGMFMNKVKELGLNDKVGC